jgi:hypothetical protein
MDDLTFGVKISGTGDGSLVSDAKAAKQSLEDLQQSTEMLAEDYAKLNAQALASGQAWLQGNAATDAAKDKAWALASGYKEVDGQLLKAGIGMKAAAVATDEVAFASHRAYTEMVVMGREAARGNFSRMAGSASILVGGLSPLALGIAAVTAALGAAGYAWYEYKTDADRAAEADETAQKSQLKLLDGLDKEIQFLKDKHTLQTIGIIGEKVDLTTAIAKAKANLDLAQSQYILNSSIRDGMAATHDSTVYLVAFTNAQKDYDDLVSRVKTKDSLKGEDDQSKKNAKILADAQRFDQQATESHLDALGKWVEAWKHTEVLLTSLGAAGTAQREQHEKAYTIYINAENEKRNAAAAASAKKEKDALDKHLAAKLSGEYSYFAQIDAAAKQAAGSATARENLRYKKEVDDWKRRYDAAKADHALTLKEEADFQAALAKIRGEHIAIQQQGELGIVNFSHALRDGDFKDAMGMAMQMTAGLSAHSRAAFEVNKVASLAKATVSGYQMIQASAADGATWGGYWGALAEGGLAALYVAANLDAINSTQFGGGGNISSTGGSGGGVPSQATSPGVPVSQTAPNAAASTSAPKTQPVTVNIYNTGNVLSPDYIDNVVIAQIKSRISNADVTIIDPRSRQAQMLAV